MELFIERLKREVREHPQKAALLGVLLFVSLWFWAPLVTRWFEADKTPAHQLAQPVTEVAVGDSAAVDFVEEEEEPWQTFAKRLEHDRRTTPVGALGLSRDPFQVVQAQATNSETPADEAKPAHWSPRRLGMKLTSTVVGAGRRVAMIDGRAYREGSRIMKRVGNQTVQFELARVAAKHVVLVQGENAYRLKIERVHDGGVLVETVER